MDNLTHSLTGAVAARVLDGSQAYDRRTERALFWLTVVSANAPDLDVVVDLFAGPFTAIEHHRGITHSVIAAPLFAVGPALLFWAFNRRAPFAAFWLRAFIGGLVHILFDMITSYGTKVFLPFTDHRYALDWMFIIDPAFTLTLGVLLWVQRRSVKRRRVWIIGAALFAMTYLGIESVLHGTASRMFEQRLEEEGLIADRTAVLPQPFTIFRWMGAAHTQEGAVQAFFSVFDDTPRHLLYLGEETDSILALTRQEPEVEWYKTRFARVPYVKSITRDTGTTVEYADLQFSFDRRLAEVFGMSDAPQPFVLEIRYDSLGRKIGADLRR